MNANHPESFPTETIWDPPSQRRGETFRGVTIPHDRALETCRVVEGRRSLYGFSGLAETEMIVRNLAQTGAPTRARCTHGCHPTARRRWGSSALGPSGQGDDPGGPPQLVDWSHDTIPHRWRIAGCASRLLIPPRPPLVSPRAPSRRPGPRDVLDPQMRRREGTPSRRNKYCVETIFSTSSHIRKPIAEGKTVAEAAVKLGIAAGAAQGHLKRVTLNVRVFESRQKRRR